MFCYIDVVNRGVYLIRHVKGYQKFASTRIKEFVCMESGYSTPKSNLGDEIAYDE